MNKNIDILNGMKIAHRGLWNDKYPENSLGAFKRAVDRNIPIELDVHILKDDTLVVFHDDNLMRMTGKNVRIKDVNYEDIKDLRLGKSNYKIPTFSEVLELVNGKVLLDIEIKSSSRDFRVCEQVSKKLDNYKGDFVVTSFNPIYLWWFRKNRSNYIRGILVSKLVDVNINRIVKYVLYNMWFNFLAKPDFIVFDSRDLPNKKIDKLYKQGVKVLLYSVKDDEIMNYKYSGLIYDERVKY